MIPGVTPPEHDRTLAELMMRSHAGGGGGGAEPKVALGFLQATPVDNRQGRALHGLKESVCVKYININIYIYIY